MAKFAGCSGSFGQVVVFGSSEFAGQVDFYSVVSCQRYRSAPNMGTRIVQNQNRFYVSLAKSPILWGGLVSAGFYVLLQLGTLGSRHVQENWGDHRLGQTAATAVSFLQQYFAGHPVEYVTTVFFFIGLSALAIKALELAFQPWRRSGDELLLGPVARGGQSVGTTELLLARLDTLPRGRQNRFLVARLREVLERIRRRNSAEGLEDELKFLADRQADRLHDSYALFRVVIWAIPVLGFLGTVIGITLALANLSPTAIEDSMPATIAALSVAFATTTQALSLSIILMFARYLIVQVENRLMGRVDRWADEELLGRFEQVASGAEGQLSAVRRMSETMIDASEHLVRRQTELWQKSIDESHKRWTQLTGEAERHLGTALARALQESLRAHAVTLSAAEQEAAVGNQRHWQQVQRSLSEGAAATVALQEAVNEEAEVLRRTVDATGQVAKLEAALNRNLAALAGAKHFEQTVMSLAAAIQLLCTRLDEVPDGRADVQLRPKKTPGQAA